MWLFCGRSLSSAEAETSHGRPSDSWLHASTSATSYNAASSSRSAAAGRQSGLVRSSSQDDAESSSASSGYATADRPVNLRTSGSASGTGMSNRGSFYASGTQSAYGSRDASPDLSAGPRRVTGYPAAPPSMIITPSHTPRRAASVDPDSDTPLTSADILRLYEKLNAIERETERDVALAAATAVLAADRRGKAAAGADDNGASSRTAAKPAGGDSQTSGTAGKTSVRSASVSPRSARRQFYDDYPYDPSKRAGGGSAGATASGGEPGGRSAAGESSSRAAPGRPDPSHAPRSASVSRDDPLKSRLTSAASSFFQSIKDRRKLFGAKKSSSVDSATQSSIARIGANVLTEPAAPSTYQPPEIPEHQPTGSSGGGGRGRAGGKLHQRTVSADVATPASTDMRGAAAPQPSQQERSSSVSRDGTYTYVAPSFPDSVVYTLLTQWLKTGIYLHILALPDTLPQFLELHPECEGS